MTEAAASQRFRLHECHIRSAVAIKLMSTVPGCRFGVAAGDSSVGALGKVCFVSCCAALQSQSGL